MVASQYGHTDIVNLLLDHGVDIDHMQQRYKCTALWWACRSNRTEIVELLIRRGADFCIKDWKGRTPGEIAKSKSHDDCVALIEVSQFDKFPSNLILFLTWALCPFSSPSFYRKL